MYNIKIEVRGQSLGIEQETIASNTLDYLTAKVIFSEDYQGLSKWLHIKKQGSDEEPYLINLNENDEVTRDMHLNLSEGTWEVFLHATSLQGMRITTIPCELLVRASGLIKGGQPLPEIPPSVAEQLDIKIQKALDIAQSVKDDADSGKFNGFSPIVKTEITQGGHNVLITDKDGVKSFYVKDGINGTNGKDGKDGINGTNGKDGQDGKDGLNGKDGENGADGKTPVKGVDYFTPQDIAEIKKPLEDELQNLDHDKLGVERVVVGNDVVSQVEADEILSNYGNYDGKEIEFLTNGDLPNKVVARGHLVTDKDGNQYLIVVGVQGHIMRFHKGGVEYPYYRKKEVDYLQDVQNEYLVNTLGSFATKQGNPIVTTDSKNWGAKCEFSGSTSQEVRSGKNLFDLTKFEVNTGTSLNITKEGTGVRIKGKTPTDIEYPLILNKIPIYFNAEVGTTFTFSIKNKSPLPFNLSLFLRSSQYGQIGFNLARGESSATKVVANEMDTIDMIISSFEKGKDIDIFIEDIQLEVGSVATSFEKYGKAPSPNFATPVVRAKFTHVGNFGKNYYDGIKATNGYLGNNGFFTTSPNFDIAYMPCEENKQYTIVKSKSSRFIVATSEISLTAGNQTPISSYLFNNPNATTATIITPKGAKFLNIQYTSPTDHSNETDIRNSIIVSDKGQTYTLSVPIELGKWDRVIKREDVWGKGSKTEEVIYNGNEDWKVQNEGQDDVLMYIKLLKKGSNNYDLSCNMGRRGDIYTGGRIEYGLQIIENRILLRVRFEGIKTLVAFKELLAKTNMMFEYETEEETFTPLPQADQELLNRIATYYPNSTITTDEGVTIKAEYLLDMKNYVDQNYAPKQSVQALEREMIK